MAITEGCKKREGSTAIGKTISLDESGQDASPCGVEKDFRGDIRVFGRWWVSNFVNWAGRVKRDSYDLPRGMEQPGSSRGS